MMKKRISCTLLYCYLPVFILCLMLSARAQSESPNKKEENAPSGSKEFVIEDEGIPTSLISMQGRNIGDTFQKDIVTTTPFIQRILLDEKDQWVRLYGGSVYKDRYAGKGKEVTSGVVVYVHFKLSLDTGQELENTFNKKAFYSFTFGNGEVLKAFEKCVETMREGGKRILLVPAKNVFPGVDWNRPELKNRPIQADSTLIFDISLCWLRQPEWDKMKLFK